MNAKNKRLEQLEAEVRRQVKQRVEWFWEQFSEDELEAITDGYPSPETLVKFEQLDGERLLSFQDAIMTPEEQAEIEEIRKRLQEEDQHENEQTKPADSKA